MPTILMTRNMFGSGGALYAKGSSYDVDTETAQRFAGVGAAVMSGWGRQDLMSDTTIITAEAAAAVVNKVFGISGWVALGDSRAQYNERPYKTTAWTSEALSGVTPIGVLDNATNGTGSVDYSTTLGIRWSSSGTESYGAWYSAAPGVHDIVDGLGYRLRIGVHSASGLPGSSVARSLTVGGSAIVGYQANGIVTWLARYFGGAIPVETWGIGGITAVNLAGQTLSQILGRIDDKSTKCAVILCGTNDVSGVSSDGNIEAIVSAERNIWLALAASFGAVLIIEEHARFVGGTSNALGSSSQKCIRAINAAARVFADSNRSNVRVIPALAATVAPSSVSLTPRTGALEDGVHPSIECCQFIGARGAQIAAEIVAVADATNALLKPVVSADGATVAFGGTQGLQVGTSGGHNAGSSGPLSTGWTAIRNTGSDAMVCSKVARTDMPGHEWQRAEVASASGAVQHDFRLLAITLASMGLAAGDRVRFAVELSVNQCSGAGTFEPFWQFNEPAAIMVWALISTGGTTAIGTHGVMWYVSPEITIPAGCTTMGFRVRMNAASGGSYQVDIGQVCAQKIY